VPAYEDGTECSETSAYKIQTPGNYPEENIQRNSTSLDTLSLDNPTHKVVGEIAALSGPRFVTVNKMFTW